DEWALCVAVLAEHVACEVLNLSSPAGHASGLPGASEAVLTSQHPVDLLRLEARKLFRRGAGAIDTQGRSLMRLYLIRAEAAVAALDLEHSEHPLDAIAPQAKLELIVDLIIGNADSEHLAHRRVGEVVMHPSCKPPCLRDLGDGSAGQLDQPAANGATILRGKGCGAVHKGHVERHASSVDVFERPILSPLFAR